MTGDINAKCSTAIRNYFEAARRIKDYLIKGTVAPNQRSSPGIPEDDARLFGFVTGITLDDALKQIPSMARDAKRSLLTNAESTSAALSDLAMV